MSIDHFCNQTKAKKKYKLNTKKKQRALIAFLKMALIYFMTHFLMFFSLRASYVSTVHNTHTHSRRH